MGRSRGKLELYRDVLRCCSKGESKSHVMYKCGLSWSQIEEVLPFLMGKGFLQTSIEQRNDENGHKRVMTVYTTTGQGMTLLMAIENVDIMLGRSPPNGLCYVATATR